MLSAESDGGRIACSIPSPHQDRLKIDRTWPQVLNGRRNKGRHTGSFAPCSIEPTGLASASAVYESIRSAVQRHLLCPGETLEILDLLAEETTFLHGADHARPWDAQVFRLDTTGPGAFQ